MSKTTQMRIGRVAGFQAMQTPAEEWISGKEKTGQKLLWTQNRISGGGLTAVCFNHGVRVGSVNSGQERYLTEAGDSYTNGVATVTLVRKGRVSDVIKLETINPSHQHFIGQ